MNFLRDLPLKHTILFAIFEAIFIGLGPTIALFSQFTSENFFIASSKKIMLLWDGRLAVVLVFFSISFPVIEKIWREKAGKIEANERSHMTELLLKMFNDVVGCKLNRFVAINAKKNTQPCCLSITKPEDQIIELLEKLHELMKSLYNCDVHIILMEVEQKNFTGQIFSAPRSYVPTGAITKNTKDTFFESVLKKDKQLCISDISSHKNTKSLKFKPNPNGGNDYGSILGFPLKSPSGHNFVLTMKSEKIDLQKIHEDKNIKEIMKMFSIRLNLERELITVSEKYKLCQQRHLDNKKN